MDEGKYIHRRNSRAGSRSLWTHMTCSTTIQTCTAVRQDGPRYPLEVLTIFDIMLMDLVALIELLFKKHIPTRICNLKSLISLRNLNPSGDYFYRDRIC
jgi:DNA replication licensing factor MCM4